MGKIYYDLLPDDRAARRVPPEVFMLARYNEVFVEDFETGEWIEVIDLACDHVHKSPNPDEVICLTPCRETLP